MGSFRELLGPSWSEPLCQTGQDGVLAGLTSLSLLRPMSKFSETLDPDSLSGNGGIPLQKGQRG